MSWFAGKKTVLYNVKKYNYEENYFISFLLHGKQCLVWPKFYRILYIRIRSIYTVVFRIALESSSSRAISTDKYDDYSYDAKLELKNVEGATRVVVEILTEGMRVPFKMEIPNFKEGSFVATFDKNFSAKVTPITYNKNGSTRGETLTVLPVSQQQLSFDIELKGKVIEINSYRRNAANDMVDYTIYNLDMYSNVAVLDGTFKDGLCSIDVSSLKPGMYVLSLRDIHGKVHNKKIMIR